MKFAICDIETTDGNGKIGKITEIAILLVEDGIIIDEFISLVNPEISIPPFVVQLTGISDSMVVNAPKFSEISKRIFDITDNAVFVAHNAIFDYNFLVSEFFNIDINFARKKICTLFLSKKMLPGHSSYKLGNLCKDLGIELIDKHRAYSDARATVDLFLLLYNMGMPDEPRVLKEKLKLNSSLKLDVFREIPQKRGVFRFLDANSDAIYICQSNNMYQKVLDIFYDSTSKSEKIRKKCVNIFYEVIESELIAALVEAVEILKHKPLLNKYKVKNIARFGIFDFEDKKGYKNLFIDSTYENNEKLPYQVFAKYNDAFSYLLRIAKRHNLSFRLCGYNFAQKYSIDNVEIYNKRVETAINEISFANETFFISETSAEFSQKVPFVIAEKGSFVGYGYMPSDASVVFREDCIDFLEMKLISNKKLYLLAQTYMKSKKCKVLRFVEN